MSNYPRSGNVIASPFIKIYRGNMLDHCEVEDVGDGVAIRIQDDEMVEVILTRDPDLLRVMAGALLQIADHIEALNGGGA